MVIYDTKNSQLGFAEEDCNLMWWLENIIVGIFMLQSKAYYFWQAYKSIMWIYCTC